MLQIHLIISLSCISEHTSTDLLSHAYYRDPYFDFMAPLADVTRLKQIYYVAERNHNCTTKALALCR